MQKKRLFQIVLPVLAAMIWGSAFVFQSVAADSVDPFTFNASRSIIAAVFLAIILIFKRRAPGSGKQRRGSRRKLFIGGILCGTALFAASNLQQLGLGETGAGKAGFITALYIVIVPVFGLFLRRRTSGLVWAGVALAVAGLYLLCVGSGFSIAASDLYLVLCALVFAAHILIIDRFAPDVGGIELSCAQFAVAGILSFICMLIFEDPDAAALRGAAWSILYVGIFSSGVAYTLQIIAQRYSDPAVVSLLLSLESVFAVIFGALILSERLSARELTGCALMLAAVTLAQFPPRKKRAGISAEQPPLPGP
ncbi:MAG: DMT family transporter [Clostridiales bacterium]|jgi:drug/metabolite transporter (DMT)-like permease|nr:DMT family transporter [Clostridiales bacterium]